MNRRTRIVVEQVLAATGAVLSVLTALWPDWIELASGWDPDKGNGSIEVGIIFILVVVSGLLYAASRIERRRLAASA